MDRLRNAIRRDVEHIVASVAQPRYGTVASTDPASHSIRVFYQPEEVLSPWMPDTSAFATAGGFGVVAPLAVGDQVIVDFVHGDADHPFLSGRVYSTVDPPPVSPATGKAVQPGEFAVFTAGAWIHFSGGQVYGSATQWNLIGDLHVDGDVYDKHGSLDRLRGNYGSHTHGNVQNGGGTTGTTTKPDPE